MIEPLQICNLGCAITNQAVLYIATLVPSIIIIVIIHDVFAQLDFHGVVMLIVLCSILIVLSFTGLVPWYISILITAISTWSQFSGRGNTK